MSATRQRITTRRAPGHQNLPSGVVFIGRIETGIVWHTAVEQSGTFFAACGATEKPLKDARRLRADHMVQYRPLCSNPLCRQERGER